MLEKKPTAKDKDTNSYRKQKFYYLLDKIPFSFFSVFGFVYVYFFWDILGLDSFLFIIGMVIYGIFNALNDPLLGQWSDRTDVNRWGSRRAIFIKYGGPIWALFFFTLWIPWSYDNQIIIFLHFIVMVILFDNMLTLVVLVWDALLPEIAETIEDRNKIFLYANLLGTIASIPILFSLSIMKAGLIYFQIFSGILAIGSAIIFFISGSKLRERPELHQETNAPGFKESIKQCIQSKSFVSFSFYRFFNVLNGYLLMSFVFAYVLLFPAGFETILLIIVGIGGLIGQIIFVKLSEKIEIHSLIVKGMILSIIMASAGFLISLIDGTELIWYSLLIIKVILSGSAVFINPYLLLVCDEDEMKYDTRREGMFLGTNAIFNKVAETLGPIVAVTVLVLFSFRQNAPEGYVQSETAIIGIKFLLLVIPSILDILGLISLRFYPIKGEYLKELKNYIEKAHKEKLIEYESSKGEE